MGFALNTRTQHMLSKHVTRIATVLAMTALVLGTAQLAAPPAGATETSVAPVSKPTAPVPPKVISLKAGDDEEASTDTPYDEVVDVFSGDTTIAGEKVRFPQENPSVKSLIVTLALDERTGWHRHGTPLFAYILQGELTVTYEGIGKRLYKKGDGLLEAMNVTHQGHNTGDEPVRVLAVFLLGDDDKPTIPEEAPKIPN